MSPSRRETLVGGASLALGLLSCAKRGGAMFVPTEPSVALGHSSSHVFVVKPSQYPSLSQAVRAVIAASGGLSFIREGQTVLLKPAANSEHPYPATTDPEFLLEVAKAVQERGGTAVIADRTMFMHSTSQTFKKLGYFEVASQARIQCLSLDESPVTSVRHRDAVHWGGVVPVYRPVVEADHLINLCTPRTHFLGDFTMALKNWVGIVDGGARLRMHVPWGFKQRLAELSLVVRPSLVLMDGRKGFTDGGPNSGDLDSFDFLAAGTDPIAMDAVGLANLRIAGANSRISQGSIWSLPLMARAVELVPSGVPRLHLTGLAADETARWFQELG